MRHLTIENPDGEVIPKAPHVLTYIGLYVRLGEIDTPQLAPKLWANYAQPLSV